MSSTDSHMKHHDHGSEECKKICGDSADKCHKSGAECQHEKHAGCTPACHPGDHKDCAEKSLVLRLTHNMPESHPHHHEHGSEECKKECVKECTPTCHQKGCSYGENKCGHTTHAKCTEICHKDKPEGDECKGCCKSEEKNVVTQPLNIFRLN
ncbi:hypothetical protein ACTXT7_001387 [Hymenolepis weldensis]